MTGPVEMVEVWRGNLCESVHFGHAVVCDHKGEIVQSWGDPKAIIYPRSSCKMIQALPLIESGAANSFGLTTKQLALACASHNAAPIHTIRVKTWLKDLGLGDSDLRCGAQPAGDRETRHEMLKSDKTPCQYHNNCSGKHAGFLTLNKHLGGPADYELHDHPVQQAAKAAFEDTTGETSPYFGIDGCSAPNHACSIEGFARALAFFANAHRHSDTRSKAATRLVDAMRDHPELVAGEGRACTELMRATDGKVALKTGAEAVFSAILPEQGLGIAVKISDGSTRASEAAIAALLVKFGVLDANHPATLKRLRPVQTNWRGLKTGYIQPAASLL